MSTQSNDQKSPDSFGVPKNVQPQNIITRNDVEYSVPDPERTHDTTTEKKIAIDDLNDYIFVRRRKGRKHKNHRGHRRKRMKRWKKVVIGIASTLLALVVAFVATIAILSYVGKAQLLNNDGLSINVPDSAESTDDGMYIDYNGVRYKYNENITSILCMGIDRESLKDDDGELITVDGNIGEGGQADSLFLVTLDMQSGETKLINISRETMTDIGIYSVSGNYIQTKTAQICLAYAYGDGAQTSCENELEAVRNLFYNVPINSYLSLDLDGIAAINDAIGGVTVVSPETIGSFTEGETYTLDGELAHEFVRSRSHKVIEGNSLRMERQKVYLEGFASTLISQTKSDITTPLNIFNVAQQYTCTDLNTAKVVNLAITAINGNYQGFEIETIPGKVKQGEQYAEFYVNEDKFFELFLDVYYDPVE